MYFIGFPLLLIPFAVYNIITFLFRVGFTDTLFSVHMISGAEWNVSTGDILLVFALCLLFVEILKATRIGNRSIVDHVLSLFLFIAMLGEFIVVQAAATSIFLILLVISLIDVAAGFSVTIRTAQRDIGIEAAETLRPS